MASSSDVLEKDSAGKTRLIRLVQNKEYDKVGPFIKEVKSQLPDPKQFIDYLETQDNTGQYALNYAKNSIKRYLVNEYQVAEDNVLASTNVPYLFDTLNNLKFNSALHLNVLERLQYLSGRTPNDFIMYEGLFASLQTLLDNSTKFYSNIHEILQNITMDYEQVPQMKRKFYKFLSQTDKDTDSLHYLLKQIKVFQRSFDNVFNMSEIMASDTTHVYALLGHGCVHMEETYERLTVPDGVIWIEMAVCGHYAYVEPFKAFINDDISDFLLNTPVPVDEASKIAYQNFLYQKFDGTVQAKFPGDKVASGNNSLFSNHDNYYVKSGIHRLYEPKKDAIEYIRKIRSPMNDTLIRSIYDGSIYPTVEDAIKKQNVLLGFTIEIEEIFQQISSQTYVARKPMIIINSGCRNPCGQKGELEGPSLRRQNSETAQSNLLKKLSTEELLQVKPNGTTRLLFLMKEKMYTQAAQLVERLSNEIDPREFLTYLDRTIKSDDGEKLLTAYDMIPTDDWDLESFFDEKKSEAREQIVHTELARINAIDDVSLVFEELIKNANKYGMFHSIIQKLITLASTHPDDFIRYPDLFTSILKLSRIQHFASHYVVSIFKNIASTSERIAALKAKFEAFERENTEFNAALVDDLKHDLIGAHVYLKGGFRNTRKKRKHAQKRLSRRNNYTTSPDRR